MIGDATTDGSLCRDLCARNAAIVISVDYRHAPEHRFPAAMDDGLAAVGGSRTTRRPWVATRQVGRVRVGAGATIAAVVCQLVRDLGGPHICGQVLFTLATDWAATFPSHVENAGAGLTTALVRWFADHYVDRRSRRAPVLPLRARTTWLACQPQWWSPAEFDPVRDEGDSYAEALAAAGVPTRHIRARGHTHSSLTMIDLVVSGAPVRRGGRCVAGPAHDAAQRGGPSYRSVVVVVGRVGTTTSRRVRRWGRGRARRGVRGRVGGPGIGCWSAPLGVGDFGSSAGPVMVIRPR